MPLSGEAIRLMNYIDDVAVTLRRVLATIPTLTAEERARVAEHLLTGQAQRRGCRPSPDRQVSPPLAHRRHHRSRTAGPLAGPGCSPRRLPRAAGRRDARQPTSRAAKFCAGQLGSRGFPAGSQRAAERRLRLHHRRRRPRRPIWPSTACPTSWNPSWKSSGCWTAWPRRALFWPRPPRASPSPTWPTAPTVRTSASPSPPKPAP